MINMSCGNGTAKFILIFFNLVFFLIGAGFIALGAWILTAQDDDMMKILGRVPPGGEQGDMSEEDLDENYESISLIEGAAYALLAVGGFLFTISFCGCCGAIKQSKCLLCTYIFLVVIITLLEIGVVVLNIVFKDKIKQYADDYFKSTIELKYEGSQVDENGNLDINLELYTAAWDLAMVQFKCCGTFGPEDFFDSITRDKKAVKWNNIYKDSSGHEVEMVVPPTCCKMEDESQFPKHPENIVFKNISQCVLTAQEEYTHQEGCSDAVLDKIKSYLKHWYFSIIIVVVQILVLVSACYLIKNKSD